MTNVIRGAQAPEFRHDDDCNGARLDWRIGHEGDRLWKCLTCGRFKVQPLDKTGAPIRKTEPHDGSPYRCRAHHDVRVDRKGRGCPKCAAERRPRRAPQADPIEYALPDPFNDRRAA